MIKVSNVLLSLILIGVGVASTYPFIQSNLSENEPVEIILHEDKVELLPGQKYSISPLIKNRKGEILTNKVCEYTSSNPNVVSFEDVHKGVFTARSETLEGDSASILVKYENLSAEFTVEITNGEGHIINLNLDCEGISNDVRVLKYGQNYGISYTTYPLIGDTDGVKVSVTDRSHNPVQGLLEVENTGSFIVRPVGVGSGYVVVEKANEKFNIPFIAKFQEDAINNALHLEKNIYTSEGMKDVHELEVEPVGTTTSVLARPGTSELQIKSISLAELDLFTGLSTLTIVNDERTNIQDYQHSNFDIVLKGKGVDPNVIYKSYEDMLGLDPQLLKRIYPASNVENSVLTVVYYFNVDEYEKYEVVNYTNLDNGLLGKKDGWDKFHTEDNNRYWYYDVYTYDRVEALEDIQVPRIKLYGKFVGETFTIKFIVGDDVYLSKSIQYNTRLEQDDIAALQKDAVEDYYGNLKFYGWLDPDGNAYDVGNLYVTETNLTIVARIRSQFNIVYNLNGGSIVDSTGGADYEHIIVNDTFSFLDSLTSNRANSKFECWYCNGQLITGSKVFDFASDNYEDDTITIVAKYSGSFTAIDAFNNSSLTDIDIAVLDLSSYTGTASTVISVPSNIDSLKIIGKSSSTAINSRLMLGSRSKNLSLVLENVILENSSSSAVVDLTGSGNYQVNIALVGTNKITSKGTGAGISAKRINIEGTSASLMVQAGSAGATGINCTSLSVTNTTLKVYAGNGTAGTQADNGTSGTKGGTAINATEYINLDNANVTVQGGNGGKGGAGTDGSGTSRAAAKAGTAGKKGGDGGDGGSSGRAIYTKTCNIYGATTLLANQSVGGAGGAGANGTNGGNGTNAEDRGFWSADSGIDGGAGGNGGNGGKGGKGGDALVNIYCSSNMMVSSTAILTLYENLPGTGGSGGNGGQGGNGGKGGAKGSWAWGGHDGAAGKGGYGGNGGDSLGAGSYNAAIYVGDARGSSLSTTIRVYKASNAGTYKSGDKGKGGCNYGSSTPVNAVVVGTTYTVERALSDSAYANFTIAYLN